MEKLKFEKIEESRANKVYLEITYMSGDADAYETEEYYLDKINGHDLLNLNQEDAFKAIEEEIKPYQILKNILDINHENYLESYEEVKEKYGDEIANLYDNAPGDVTCWDYKQSLSNLRIIAYSTDGSKYKAYIF